MNGHHQLAEAMRRHGQSPGQAYSYPRHATISSYDPATHAVKVMVQPENIESNWMPLGAIGVGNNWGVVVGPQIGDQVHVSFAEGDFNSGVIVARVFSVQAVPPAVPSGEIWMLHKFGALLKLTNDGKVTVTDKAGSTVVLNGDGTGTATFASGMTINANTQINGNLIVSGNISDQNATKGTVQHIRDNYDVHTHGGVQTGAGNTGTPSNTI